MNEIKQTIQRYWDVHIHDLAIATHPIGSPEFFQELADYRYEKLEYLSSILNTPAFTGINLLEIGCGVGIDLVRLAKSGAVVDGIDLSPVAIELAKQNMSHNHLHACLSVMDGENMEYQDNTFDVVYAHGVIQYTENDQKMVSEIFRVLKPGGRAIMMFYNRISWLNAMSNLTNVGLEHADAPILRKYSIKEVSKLLNSFKDIRIQPERFPVETRLHHGLKAFLYNSLFVKLFNLLPRTWVRRYGWHLMVFVEK